ncbi:hypothetical protein NL676_023011 [Syzygium grande]|nr:hypothetical protein NL676_023011 [Syzygium grande]
MRDILVLLGMLPGPQAPPTGICSFSASTDAPADLPLGVSDHSAVEALRRPRQIFLLKVRNYPELICWSRTRDALQALPGGAAPDPRRYPLDDLVKERVGVDEHEAPGG